MSLAPRIQHQTCWTRSALPRTENVSHIQLHGSRSPIHMNRYALIRTLDLLLMAVLLASPAVSQNAPQSPPLPGKVFTLKTTTEVVLVNVTVKDRSGKFVRDLKQE